MARLLGPDRSRGTIIVLAKAPRPGFAKTRLSPPFTAEEASELYAHMLDDVLAATSGFARELALSAFVAIHPPAACPEIAVGAPASMHVIPQCGRDLPERMAWAVSEAAASGATRILLRGSDSPMLDQQSVAEAIERLDDSDLVLCPDLDGGYSLVGLRQPAPGLFDHPMSTQNVVDDTLANAAALGLQAHLLDARFDIDTASDLRHLAAARDRVGTELCPRTIAYLDENDLWTRG